MNLVYIGSFDSNGISNLLNKGTNNTNIKESFAQPFLNEVNSYFPESKKLYIQHPEWISDNTINILDNNTIKVSFVSEGAGYRNSFGYYIYDTDKPPKNINYIKTVYIVFPNASASGSGGGLNSGDSVLLPSAVSTSTVNNLIIGTPTDYVFKEGKSVGFVIFANGWKDTYVNKNAPRYFTDSTLNPEKADWLKYHTALVKTSNGKLVMGMEDLPREESSCDHDFNDLVVLVTIDLTKISPGNYSDPHESLGENAPIEYEMGYKKLFVDVIEKDENDNDVIKIAEALCVLRIPLTSTIIKHNLSNKFRTNRVYVYSIIGTPKTIFKDKIANGKYAGKEFESAHSSAFSDFIYTKNAWVTSALNTNKNINADGIHFFRNRTIATSYKFDY
jgi:hypothetical protein